MACGGVLEGGEGLVLLQGLRQLFSSLSVKAILLQTANDNQTKASGGADSRRTVCYSVLERDQDRILFEIICQKHGVPNFEAVVR